MIISKIYNNNTLKIKESNQYSYNLHQLIESIKGIKMSKKRTLINGEEAEELDSSVNLIIKTKCPTKWIIEDLETGQRYRANGNTEIGKMFTPI